MTKAPLKHRILRLEIVLKDGGHHDITVDIKARSDEGFNYAANAFTQGALAVATPFEADIHRFKINWADLWDQPTTQYPTKREQLS